MPSHAVVVLESWPECSHDADGVRCSVCPLTLCIDVQAGKGWDRAFEILAKHAPATSKTNSTAVLHSYKSCSKADATAQNLVINISP